MKKVIVALGVAVLFAAAATGVASADQPPTTDGFVCPVLGGNAAPTGNANDPIVGIAGGDYTVLGPDVYVPLHATNGEDGSGDPGGAHASPGDDYYSPIWNTGG